MEFNLVRPAATPFVFHSLLHEDDEDHDTGDRRYILVYGGDKKQPFSWTRLAISSVTGKLYHPIDTTKPNKQSASYGTGKILELESMQQQEQQQEYALIRSAVAVALSDRIVAIDSINDDLNDSSGMAIILKHRQHVCNRDDGDDDVDQQHSPLLHPIPWLPLEAEPGPWAMPYNEMSE